MKKTVLKIILILTIVGQVVQGMQSLTSSSRCDFLSLTQSLHPTKIMEHLVVLQAERPITEIRLDKTSVPDQETGDLLMGLLVAAKKASSIKINRLLIYVDFPYTSYYPSEKIITCLTNVGIEVIKADTKT